MDIKNTYIKLIQLLRIIDVKKALSKLRPDEIELINSLYYQEASFGAYDQNNGLSYLQASRKKTKIFEKLSKYIKQ